MTLIKNSKRSHTSSQPSGIHDSSTNLITLHTTNPSHQQSLQASHLIGTAAAAVASDNSMVTNNAPPTNITGVPLRKKKQPTTETTGNSIKAYNYTKKPSSTNNNTNTNTQQNVTHKS